MDLKEYNNKYVQLEQANNIVKLKIDFTLLLERETFEYKNSLLNLLEEIDKNTSVRVLIFSNDHYGFSLDKWAVIWNEFYSDNSYETHFIRIFRIYNELLLKIKSLKKVIISVNTEPTNCMLFNFSLIADLRVTSNSFFINNNNTAMLNIPKGSALFTETNLSYINPVKMLFSSDRIYSVSLLKRYLIDKIFNQEEVFERTEAIAYRMSKYDYVEFEAVKIIEQKRLRKLEASLQRENEYLLSCIRKKINQNENSDR